MNAKTKTNSVITSRVEGATIIFTVLGAGELTLDVTKLSPEVRARAAIHGLIQRVSDAAALSRNPENGAAASPAEKLAAMKARVDHYNSGSPEWSMRIASPAAEGGLTLRAIANVQFSGDIERARAAVATMAEKQGKKPAAILATLARATKVAEEMARIRPASGVDADALLGELG